MTENNIYEAVIYGIFISSCSLWGVLHAVLFNTVLFFAFASHLRAMMTDPGIVPISRKGYVNSSLFS